MMMITPVAHSNVLLDAPYWFSNSYLHPYGPTAQRCFIRKEFMKFESPLNIRNDIYRDLKLISLHMILEILISILYYVLLSHLHS